MYILNSVTLLMDILPSSSLLITGRSLMCGMARSYTTGEWLYNIQCLYSYGMCLLSCWCRGYRILTAIMEDLNLNRNLKQATDVVLTGCSGQPLSHHIIIQYEVIRPSTITGLNFLNQVKTANIRALYLQCRMVWNTLLLVQMTDYSLFTLRIPKYELE